MLRPAIATRVLMTTALVMGFTFANTTSRTGILIRPDEYLRLKLKHTLRRFDEQRPDRCSPVPELVAAARSSSAPCSLMDGSVPYGGECHHLLLQGPCPAHYWIVLNKKTERATCQFTVCPDHHVLVAGGCVRLGTLASTRHCPSTLQLIINEYGEAECECPMRRVFYKPARKCYDLFEQGPCGEGHVLQMVEKDGKTMADCVPSLCTADGQVPMTTKCELAKPSVSTQGDGSYTCYKMSSSGPCSTGFLGLDRALLDVVCTTNQPYGIWNSLSGGTPCTPGSVRDSARDCRRNMTETVNEVVTKSIPTVKPGYFGEGNVCPRSYVFLAGTCLHIQSGH